MEVFQLKLSVTNEPFLKARFLEIIWWRNFWLSKRFFKVLKNAYFKIPLSTVYDVKDETSCIGDKHMEKGNSECAVQERLLLRAAVCCIGIFY